MYNISRHIVKTLLHYRVEFKNVAITPPILDDKAMLNFYDNFVNC